MKTLTIISHTEHYRRPDNRFVGWGPTITEINNLLLIFDKIYHVAMLHNDEPPPSALPYSSERVIFVPIPALGGPKISDKVKLILNIPIVIRLVRDTLKNTDYFQLRVPTGIGVFLIPYLSFFIKKKGWFKYAGNWNQEQPPIGYGIQKWMLKKQARKVTINGSWPGQPKQCLTFENPCLTKADIEEGLNILKKNSSADKLTFCYVGRLEKAKGVERIIKSIDNLKQREKDRIDRVHLVGNGEDIDYFKSISVDTGVVFEFHGFLARKDVFEIYKRSHFFLMPTSASEGFPKVIAEAMNFGCVPIVSLVSSIGQYIKHLETGICMNTVNLNDVSKAICTGLNLSELDYKRIIHNQKAITKLFTFSHYNNRIEKEIL